jgi:hypothetical protein
MGITNYDRLFKPERRLYFRMDDKTQSPPIMISSYDDCAGWCIDGWGVFHCVQSFKGKDRRKSEIANIDFWAVDIDGGDKKTQIKIIRENIKPSYVVESAGGYHVYFKALNATVLAFSVLMERLVKGYGADKNAKDLARILRVPGFNHYKGRPFLCREVYYSSAEYTEEEMFKLTRKWKEKTVKKTDIREYDSDYVPKDDLFKGNRNSGLNRYGYILKAKCGKSLEQVRYLLHRFNFARVHPPLSDFEVENIIKSIGGTK